MGEMSAGDSSDELDVFSSGDESDGADAPPLAPSQRCPLSCSPWNELQALGYQLGDRVQGGAQRQTKQMVAGATIMAEKLERALFAPEVVDSEAHSRPVWNKFEGCVREQSWRWDGGSRCAGARVLCWLRSASRAVSHRRSGPRGTTLWFLLQFGTDYCCDAKIIIAIESTGFIRNPLDGT